MQQSGAAYKIISCSSGLSCVGNIKQATSETVWQTDSAEKKAVVEIELAEEQKIKCLQIGNAGAAFIEVLVGQPGMSIDNYLVLLPITPVMTLSESKANIGRDRVYTFGSEKLRKAAADQKWKRLRIVCTRPFCYDVMGLGFVLVNPESTEVQQFTPSAATANTTKEDEDSSGTDEMQVGDIKKLQQANQTRMEEENDSSGTEDMAGGVPITPATATAKSQKDDDSDTDDMPAEEIKRLRTWVYGDIEPQEQEAHDHPDNEDALLGHSYPVKKLPEFFGGRCFYFYGNFDLELKKRLHRIAVAYGGEVCDYFYEDQINTVILSPNQGWDRSCSAALEKNESLELLRHGWLVECARVKRTIPITGYRAKRE